MASANGSPGEAAELLGRIGVHLGDGPIRDWSEFVVRLRASVLTAAGDGRRLSKGVGKGGRQGGASLSRLPAGEPLTHEVTVGGQVHRVTRGVFEASEAMTERMRRRYPQAK